MNFYQRALAIRERQLGASHPSTASTVANIGAHQPIALASPVSFHPLLDFP